MLFVSDVFEWPCSPGELLFSVSCRREEFIHWVEMLPDTQTPSWLGLPSNAEKVLLTTQGMSVTQVTRWGDVIDHYLLCVTDWYTTLTAPRNFHLSVCVLLAFLVLHLCLIAVTSLLCPALSNAVRHRSVSWCLISWRLLMNPTSTF